VETQINVVKFGKEECRNAKMAFSWVLEFQIEVRFAGVAAVA
jgi:hypothetical protein